MSNYEHVYTYFECHLHRMISTFEGYAGLFRFLCLIFVELASPL
jgi:hypothetical protein